MPYHHVTRESQIAIERDIAQLDWSNITSLTDPNSKAIATHSTISNIVSRHCTIKYKKVTKPITPWFDNLARKLRNAKSKSLRRLNKTAKFFSNALKKHLRQANGLLRDWERTAPKLLGEWLRL